MRVSALAVNTNYQCRTRGLECFFFRDVILKSSAMAVDFDQLLPLMLFEVVLFILKCVGTLALLFAQPKSPGSSLLLPYNIRPIYSCAEFSTNFQCFFISRLVVQI